MITGALIGAGNRGKDVYGQYALNYPDEIKFVAVAEPNDDKRREFVTEHAISNEMAFETWEDLLNKEKLCDAVFVCVQDRMHYKATIAALEKGYNVLLEKPMSYNLKECIEITEAAQKNKRILTVAHVLRYAPFFKKIKEIIDSDEIGDVIHIDLNENIAYWHFAHSYVRGNWANANTSSPIILAKSSHDMDILYWLMNERPKKISSFGSLKYFNKENAPIGSADRCIDCAVEHDCPYSAKKIYLGENTDWPVSVISTDYSIKGRLKALKEGPYGRCVYKCNNNVCDHQVVNIEFEDGKTASFTLSAFTHDLTREVKIMGTLGDLRGNLTDNRIEINKYNGEKDVIVVKSMIGRHSGGDTGLMKYFIKQIENNDEDALTSAENSLMSHVMAFAAEESRLKHKVIDIDRFMKM